MVTTWFIYSGGNQGNYLKWWSLSFVFVFFFFEKTTRWGPDFREEQSCLPDSIWNTGILFWYNKTVMSKKIVFEVRNLKDYWPNLPPERGKEKKNQSFFIETILCFPDDSERWSQDIWDRSGGLNCLVKWKYVRRPRKQPDVEWMSFNIHLEKLVWSTRIGRIVPIWILFLLTCGDWTGTRGGDHPQRNTWRGDEYVIYW